jgi:Fibronectin type III domain/IPT/TIG domain
MPTSTKLIVLAVIFACVSAPWFQATIPQSERDALIALYNSTNGSGWTRKDNWLNPPGTENTWYGVYTDDQNTHVKKLLLQINGLKGSIPPEIGNLTYLDWLGLDYNSLSGSIPPELCNLENAESVTMQSNALTGVIPQGIGNMQNLQILHLSQNGLSGSIPHEMGNLINLRDFQIANNQISGSIPAELGGLQNLGGLDFRDNDLEGPIPATLGALPNLRVLMLDANHLSGTIPAEMGSPPWLGVLTLSANKLEGPIPTSLADLKYIICCTGELELCWNALYTDDPTLKAYLDTRPSNCLWDTAQTIAPTNVYAGTTGDIPMQVRWTPIPYTEDTGGYEVSYATTSGGPYTVAGMTTDKTASFMNVEGLSPGLRYYFTVRTITQACVHNGNTVSSTYSHETSAAVVTPPTIASVVTQTNPFRLTVRGTQFHRDCTLMIDGTPAPRTKWRDEGKIVAEKGATLKTMLPKGTPVSISVVNNDDHGASAPYTFTR